MKSLNHKYLVFAIYRDKTPLVDKLTRVEHVKIISARSPSSAISTVRKDHNPDREKPTKYIASLILGPFQVNAFSNRTHTCEELLS